MYLYLHDFPSRSHHPAVLQVMSTLPTPNTPKADRVTPANLSFDERMNKLQLFVALYGMRQGDPLRRQLVSQSSISLNDVRAAFLRLHQDDTAVAAIESTTAGQCYVCRQHGHLARDCPHTVTIDKLVVDRNSKYKDRRNEKNCSDGAATLPYRRPARRAFPKRPG